jgi:hypothetical protein
MYRGGIQAFLMHLHLQIEGIIEEKYNALKEAIDVALERVSGQNGQSHSIKFCYWR